MKIDPNDPQHHVAVTVFAWALFLCCCIGLLYTQCHPVGSH